MKAIVSMSAVEEKILLIRGQKVMLDADLAKLYGDSTKVSNQAVKRNRDRFPKDFVFQLTAGEKLEVVTICDHLSKIKYSPVLPYAFTEHGAIMAARHQKAHGAAGAEGEEDRIYRERKQGTVSNK